MPESQTNLWKFSDLKCVYECTGSLVCGEHLSNRLANRKSKTHCPLSPDCRACRAERSQPVCPPYKLQLEECLSAEQVPTPELIQGYVKKVGLLYEWQAAADSVRLCPVGRKDAGTMERKGQGKIVEPVQI